MRYDDDRPPYPGPEWADVPPLLTDEQAAQRDAWRAAVDAGRTDVPLPAHMRPVVIA